MSGVLPTYRLQHVIIPIVDDHKLNVQETVISKTGFAFPRLLVGQVLSVALQSVSGAW